MSETTASPVWMPTRTRRFHGAPLGARSRVVASTIARAASTARTPSSSSRAGSRSRRGARRPSGGRRGRRSGGRSRRTPRGRRAGSRGSPPGRGRRRSRSTPRGRRTSRSRVGACPSRSSSHRSRRALRAIAAATSSSAGASAAAASAIVSAAGQSARDSAAAAPSSRRRTASREPSATLIRQCQEMRCDWLSSAPRSSPPRPPSCGPTIAASGGAGAGLRDPPYGRPGGVRLGGGGRGPTAVRRPLRSRAPRSMRRAPAEPPVLPP